MDINDSINSDGNIIKLNLPTHKKLKHKNLKKINSKKKIIKKTPSKIKKKCLIYSLFISLIIILLFLIFFFYFKILDITPSNSNKEDNLNIQKIYNNYKKTSRNNFINRSKNNNINSNVNNNDNISNNHTSPKVLICSMVKLENNYIRYFIEEHKKIGINKIVLYDNNDIDGENLTSVVLDYIESGYVTVKNARGFKKYHHPAMTKCYREYGNEYEWIGFFDIDEVVTIYNNSEFKTINEFLSLPRFKKTDVVILNFKYYDDNNLTRVINNNYSLVSRFTHHNNISWENDLVKVFFKTNKITDIL